MANPSRARPQLNTLVRSLGPTKVLAFLTCFGSLHYDPGTQAKSHEFVTSADALRQIPLSNGRDTKLFIRARPQPL
eukprot:s4323_g5.t1